MPTRRASPPAAAPGSRRWLTGPWPGLLAALLCYADSLGNGFAYDDNPIIRDNPRIRSLANLREIWLTDWWLDPEAPIQAPSRDRLYRPLTLFTFALNYALGGTAPLGYHLVNVLLHATACALLWRLTLRLTGRPAVASIAAVLFAVHPVHAEAVANVVGRAEILAGLLLMLGLELLAGAPHPPTPGRTWAAAGAFLGALLAKETAVCYLPVALLVLFAARGGWGAVGRRGWWFRLAILLVPLLVYLPARLYALEMRMLRERIGSGLFNPLRDADPVARLHGPLTILGHYARLLILPASLSCDYGLAIFDPHSGPELLTLVGAAALAGLIASLAGARSRSPVRRQLALLAAIFACSYVLISNTVLLIGVSLAERLMYWPSAPVLAGFALGAHAFWERFCTGNGPMQRRSGLLRTLGVLLLAALALRTIVRNPDWYDDTTLFTADANAHPRGAHLNTSLAELLIWEAEHTPDPELRRRILADAARRAERALAANPRFADALRQRGHVHLLEGDAPRARRYLESALLLNPADTRVRRLLARLGAEDPQRQQQRAELEEQVRSNPQDVAARRDLALLYMEQGRYYDALAVLREAYRLAPEDAEVVRLYGWALLLNHEQPEALSILRRAVALRPDDWQSHANLSRLLAETDPPASLEHARRANELAPDDLRTQINLAEAYAANGEPAEAIRRFRRIEAALPADSPLRAAIAKRIGELQRTGR